MAASSFTTGDGHVVQSPSNGWSTFQLVADEHREATETNHEPAERVDVGALEVLSSEEEP